MRFDGTKGLLLNRILGGRAISLSPSSFEQNRNSLKNQGVLSFYIKEY